MLQLSQQKILLPYHLTDTSEPTNSSSMIHNKKTASFQLCVWTPPKIDMQKSIFKQPFMKLGSSCSNQHIPAPFWQKGCSKNLLRRCPKGLETIPSLEHLPFSEKKTCLNGQAPSQHHGFWRRQTHALALWMWFDWWGFCHLLPWCHFCWFPLRLKGLL